MSDEHAPDPLDRARDLFREEAASGWSEIVPGVVEKVRSLPLPSRRLARFDADGHRTGHDDPEGEWAAERDVRGGVRRALREQGVALQSWHAHVVEHRLAELRVGLCAAYGSDLRAQAKAAHEAAAEVLHDLLGDDPAFVPDRDLTVRVEDVEVDPL